MRLTDSQRRSILRVAHDIYGEGVKVYLFGSRVDDNKRGGDIDLLIRTNNSQKGGPLARVRMISNLKMAIGDQKIDVVGDYENSKIVLIALSTGMEL